MGSFSQALFLKLGSSFMKAYRRALSAKRSHVIISDALFFRRSGVVCYKAHAFRARLKYICRFIENAPHFSFTAFYGHIKFQTMTPGWTR